LYSEELNKQLHKILLGWSNQEGWDGWGMHHVWDRSEMHTTF